MTNQIENEDDSRVPPQVWNPVFSKADPNNNSQLRVFFTGLPLMRVEVLRLDRNNNLEWEVKYADESGPHPQTLKIPTNEPPVYFAAKSLTAIVYRRYGLADETGSLRVSWPIAKEDVS